MEDVHRAAEYPSAFSSLARGACCTPTCPTVPTAEHGTGYRYGISPRLKTEAVNIPTFKPPPQAFRPQTALPVVDRWITLTWTVELLHPQRQSTGRTRARASLAVLLMQHRPGRLRYENAGVDESIQRVLNRQLPRSTKSQDTGRQKHSAGRKCKQAYSLSFAYSPQVAPQQEMLYPTTT